ncbi:YbaB/EbfC family nucleoid-associated protein [Papillibacter cinnamivorans]|uniref:Nucleoid-associated protein SAMN02745168_2157 n=1 Tax=Papillibacter cinnamivorans DSM 12816 TaxID=1122930 RepID=A0A1W2BEV5_9FIRM|nr:YbaB/EbfC family nucleoid-associated protein [Papillibacter cinnamivorans]SMC71537.1 hypothetical protein SAMN02745168_2157 [Papillibacter cinnamivorans DSM 12816]
MAKGFKGGMPMGGGMNMNMLKQAQKMQQDLMREQATLKDKEFSASVGGGAVTARVNGSRELLSIELNPEAVDPEEIELLQDMIVSAVNQALGQAEEAMNSSMKKFTGGMNLGF